jgi:hypothetical protein
MRAKTYSQSVKNKKVEIKKNSKKVSRNELVFFQMFHWN